MVGGAGHDSLAGGDGNDAIEGAAGSDIMDGGAGQNTAVYSDARANYVVSLSVDGALIVAGPNGTDSLRNIQFLTFAGQTYATTDTIDRIDTPATPSEEGLVLWGASKADRLMGDSMNDAIYGRDGSDWLNGMGGNDRLHGGTGKDVLAGGTGRDVFVFDTRLAKTNAAHRKSELDKITDFVVADDTIHLARQMFTKVGTKGVLKKGAFYLGHAAHDASDRIVYNKKTGALFYDQDGNGAHEAIQIATLSKYLKMTYKDFFII
jgi:Ca2+-binding RTX toxin-like protein